MCEERTTPDTYEKRTCEKFVLMVWSRKGLVPGSGVAIRGSREGTCQGAEYGGAGMGE